MGGYSSSGSSAATFSTPAATPVSTNAIGDYYRNGKWVDGRFVRNGAAAGAAATPGAEGPATVNTAETDPNSNWLLERLKGRMDSSDTQRAIDRATGQIADSAALIGKDARANLASRGALDSGVGGAYIKRNVTDPAQRAAAGAATDIALGEQQRLDNLTLGGAQIARTPAELALASQRLALDQRSNEAQIAAQQQAQQQAQWMALMQLTAGM